MEASGKLNRMLKLNEIAIKSMFTGVDLDKHSDYRFWALKITHITSQLANEELIRATEFVKTDVYEEIKPKIKFKNSRGQWTEMTTNIDPEVKKKKTKTIHRKI